MFFTQNPIGSSANEDLQDNAISFDYAMNSPAALWQDRFGKQHKTVQQALKDVGFKPAGFDFVSGGTLGIGNRDKCVFYPTDGYWYSWNGKLPYVVQANSSPTPGGKKGWKPVEVNKGFGEITAESFGVIPGIVSQAIAKSNADRIMSKAAEISAAGGGKIIFTSPLYQVHMNDEDYSSASASLRVAALKIPYDNVILVGQGWNATTIQAYKTNSSYGVIQWSKTPLENGKIKVSGVGLHDICIDGNYHGDFTPGSYVHQTEGVIGAGIEGLNISRLKVKNCTHYGMGLQNGGYRGCSIDGYWSENTGADGLDIKDNLSISRAFQLNNIFVFNFGQLDEPEHPWAGVDIMSVAPKVSNVYVSDFGDKGQPGAGVRIKQGPIGDLISRGTGGLWANISNITVVQNRFRASPSENIGLHIKAAFVNYSNIVTIGYDGGRLGNGVWVEERYCNGSNIQVANAINGYQATSASGASERNYGDAEACSVSGITIRDTTNALILNRKYQKLNNVTLKDCQVGFIGGGPNFGRIIVNGLYLENIADPFGQLGGSYHSIKDVSGPGAGAYQSGLAIVKNLNDFITTAVLSKNGVRLYSGSTEDSIGVELGRFTPTSCNLYAPLIVGGNAQPLTPNTYFLGTGPSPWAGGFVQAALTVTSDERYKTKPLEITDVILDAVAEIDWCSFQYLDSIETKGEDGARIHFGAIAQDFVRAFQKYHLNIDDYAFICYDEWEEQPEVIDEEGEIQSRFIPAGSRYGIRYEQAIILKQKQMERDHNRQLKTLLARIETLESKLGL